MHKIIKTCTLEVLIIWQSTYNTHRFTYMYIHMCHKALNNNFRKLLQVMKFFN